MTTKRQFTTQPHPKGFQLFLNDKVFNSPAGNHIILPTQQLADKLTAELSKSANITLPLQLTYTALDHELDTAITDCLHVLFHDSVLYWPQDNDEQAAFMTKHLSPVLRVIAEKTECVLTPSNDLSAPVIPERLIQIAETELKAFNPFALIAFREITSLLGSYLLAHLLYHDQLDASEAIRLSLIEQNFQREQWGTTDTHIESEQELTAALTGCVEYLSLVS